jgi:16S rRNA (uracil1498-N3)-methyltransferase
VSDRFFFDGPLAPGDVTLTGPEAHHLTAVRRFGPGDAVVLFNGDGHEYPATVTETGKKQVLLSVVGVEAPARELAFPLHIASALPKGNRGDFLVEKLTELGVTDFSPLLTDRAIVKAGDAKADKLERAVIEASKQCGRNMLMRVHPPARFGDWSVRQSGRRFIAHPGGPAAGGLHIPGQAVTIAIGPEGGFTEPEVQTALGAGWELLSLGPRTLRVETAAVAVAVWFGRPGTAQ